MVATFRITDSEGYAVTDSITIIVEEEEAEETIDSGGIPSLSLVSAATMLGLISISRRKFNR